MKRRLIIISGIFILFIALTYLILRVTILKDVTTVINLSNSLEYSIYNDVYMLDTINIVDGKITDQNYLLDTSEVGEKEITINYKDSNGWKKKYTYKYSVTDEIKPMLNIPKNIYMDINNKKEITDYVTFAGDNYDRELTYIVEGEYDLDTIGEYDIKVIAKDDSNNETSRDVKLHIYQPSGNTSSSNSNNSTLDKGVDINYFIKNYKTDNNSIGLDLSVYQDVEDFNLLKEQGIDFVILRLGWGPNEDYTFNTDSKFEDFYIRAKEAGLKVGVYYFSYATTIDEVDLEINYVDEMLRDKQLDLFVSYDWENWKLFKDCKMNFQDVNLMAKKFMDGLKSKGYKVANYGSKYYLENIFNLEGYDTWLAQYYDEATYNKDFVMWQISDRGNVKGVSSLVDIDILKLDVDNN